MENNLGGFRGAMRDLGKAFLGGHRPKPTAPVQSKFTHNVFKGRTVNKTRILREYANPHKKIIKDVSGRKIDIQPEQRGNILSGLIGDRTIISKADLLKNIRLEEQRLSRERINSTLPSQRLQIREQEKLLKEVKMRSLEASDPGVLDGIIKGARNELRVAIGQEPILDKPDESLNSSVINQNTPKIK